MLENLFTASSLRPRRIAVAVGIGLCLHAFAPMAQGAVMAPGTEDAAGGIGMFSDPAIPPAVPPLPADEAMSLAWVDVGAARAALRKGQWNRAVVLSSRLLAMEIPDPDALGVFATGLAAVGQNAAAQTALERLRTIESAVFDTNLVSGILSFWTGALDQAEASLSAAAGARPNDPVARFFQGKLSHVRGDPAAALDTYESIIADYPEFAPALASAARLLPEDQGRRAIDLLRRAIAVQPENTDYRRLLAEFYEKAGEGEKARQVYIDIVKEVTGVKEFALARAWRLLQSGGDQDALDAVDRAFGLYGPLPLGYLIRAMVAANLGQSGPMAEHLSSYLDMKGDAAHAHFAAGLTYLAAGEAGQARREFEQVRELRPNAVVAVTNLAVAAQAGQEPAEARDLLSEAKAAGEDGHLIGFLRANVELGEGDFAAYREALAGSAMLPPGVDGVVEDWAPLTDEQRRSIAVDRNLMMLMLMNGSYTAVVRFADEALRTVPSEALSLYFRGVALGAQNRSPEALADLKMVADAQPRFLGAHLALAATHLRAGEPQAALAAYRTADRLSPDSAAIHLGMAAALLDLEEKDQCIAALEHAETIGENGGTLFRIALVYERLGENGKARAMLTKALETGDGGAWRADARRRVASLDAKPPAGSVDSDNTKLR